jgi:hypothetical protein
MITMGHVRHGMTSVTWAAPRLPGWTAGVRPDKSCIEWPTRLTPPERDHVWWGCVRSMGYHSEPACKIDFWPAWPIIIESTPWVGPVADWVRMLPERRVGCSCYGARSGSGLRLPVFPVFRSHLLIRRRRVFGVARGLGTV